MESKTIDIKNVASVYSGKADACCCGCAGIHRYASVHREWAGKNRGYEITDDEVNDSQVKRVVNKILRDIYYAEWHDVLVSITINNRLYIAYFKTSPFKNRNAFIDSHSEG